MARFFKKKLVQRVGLILFSIFLALGLMEIGLRLFAPQYSAFIRADDVLGWWFVPGARYVVDAPEDCPGWGASGYMNAHGLRDDDYPYEREPDTFRILALGDSYTEAFQVNQDQIWTELLEQRLNERGGQRYEVINAGRSGMGTAQEYLFYTHEGYRYAPDLVVVLFIPNDLLDNTTSRSGITPYYSLQGDQLVLDTSFRDSRAWKLRKYSDWLNQSFYLASFARKLYSTYTETRAAAGADSEGNAAPAAAGYAPDVLEVSRRLFVALDDAVTANDARLMIVQGSSAAQVNWTESANWQEAEAVSASSPVLNRLPVEEGMLFLDLVPLLRAYSVEHRTLIHGCENNNGLGHWGQEGHRLAADAMYAFLIENALIP